MKLKNVFVSILKGLGFLVLVWAGMILWLLWLPIFLVLSGQK